MIAVAAFLAPAAAGAASAADQRKGAETNLPLPRFVSLRAEAANARRGPNLDQRVDWEFLRRGLPLEITAEYGQWRRVRDADGAEGWVHHTLLSGVRTVVIRAEGPVALRAQPSDAAKVRAMAEPEVVARLQECNVEWCEVVADGVEGWLPRAALWGVGPDEEVN